MPRPTGPTHAIVLFGDVVESRRDPAAATAWLRTMCYELERLYADERLAGFGFTQGDELQGLLAPTADPFRAVLHAGLHPDHQPMRWVIAAGPIEPGTGPATERTGPAFLAARAALTQARMRRDLLLARTGDARTDVLLDDLAPLLEELVEELSPKQRSVAWLLLSQGLRQADAAERLGVARATVSVVARRARVRSIGRLARTLAAIFSEGVGAAAAAEAPATGGAPA